MLQQGEVSYRGVLQVINNSVPLIFVKILLLLIYDNGFVTFVSVF